MKKVISLCLALGMACSMFSLPAAAEASEAEAIAELSEAVAAEETEPKATEEATPKISEEVAATQEEPVTDAPAEPVPAAEVAPEQVEAAPEAPAQPATQEIIGEQVDSDAVLDTVADSTNYVSPYDESRGPIALKDPATPSEKEVIDRYNAIAPCFKTPITYVVEPDPKGFTTAGVLSAETIQSGVDTVNLVRYIAGLDSVVAYESYNKSAQYASTLLANIMQLNHRPAKPAGCPDDFYKIAYGGTSSSNLGFGYGNLPSSVLNGYMDDGDSGNIDRIGHRRWILSPYMGAIGFGYAGNFTAASVFDKSHTSGKRPEYVAWPAANTPYDMWSGPMSFLVPSSFNIKNASATVTSALEGKTYVFDENSNSNGTGVFYANNQSYGYAGAIIFGKKDNKKFEKGDILTVTVKYSMNNKDYSTSYNVSLMDMETADGVDRSGFVKRLYEVCLDRDADLAGVAHWIIQLRSKTGSEVASGFIFSDEFKNKNLCNKDYIKQLYRAMMGREFDEPGLKYWLDRMAQGANREEVFNGFAMSEEFKNICAGFGITVGNEITVPEYGTIPTGSCSVCGEPDGVSAFVTRLYKVCLNRTPDANGFDYWRNRLYSRENSARDAAIGFVFSDEFKNKKYSNADFVEYLYAAFMDRKSDPAGKADWVKQLQSGKTREDVFEGFVGSQEFKNICARYGIVRG